MLYPVNIYSSILHYIESPSRIAEGDVDLDAAGDDGEGSDRTEPCYIIAQIVWFKRSNKHRHTIIVVSNIIHYILYYYKLYAILLHNRRFKYHAIDRMTAGTLGSAASMELNAFTDPGSPRGVGSHDDASSNNTNADNRCIYIYIYTHDDIYTYIYMYIHI